jgi:hypothetical protein
MGFNKKELKEASKLMYGLGRRKIELVGSISLPVSFGTLLNACTEYITFNVVDMSYPTMPSSEEGYSTPSKRHFIHFIFI